MKKLTLVFILAIATGLAACNPSGEFSSSLSLIPPLEDVIIIEDISMPSDVFGPADIIPDSVGEITVTDAIADVTVLPRYSYVVVIADTHIKTPDGLPVANATKIGQEIEKMPWPIEAVFVLGDVCYLLPYTTFQEFMDDPNDRFDIAQEIFENYPVPVYPLIGNHDIDNGPIPLVELGEQLFKHHFGVDPYYAVDVGRWRFLAMSNFKGPTHIVGDPGYDYDSGSLGTEQLEWMEEQLQGGRPTVLMSHFPPYIIKDLPQFMRAHRDQVRLMLAGHSHAWMNLSDNFGVPSMVVGTSQWDADCMMIIELDNELGTWRMLNWDKVHWGSGYSFPWDQE